eukprot:3974455-Amphidinium_carterae.1
MPQQKRPRDEDDDNTFTKRIQVAEYKVKSDDMEIVKTLLNMSSFDMADYAKKLKIDELKVIDENAKKWHRLPQKSSLANHFLEMMDTYRQTQELTKMICHNPCAPPLATTPPLPQP